MNVAAKVAIGVGAAAVTGAIGYGIYQAVRHRQEGVDSMVNGYLNQFDGNRDNAIHTQYEAKKEKEVSTQTAHTDSNGNTYYTYDRYTQVSSIENMANRADTSFGNSDLLATREELVALLKTYDTGDGDRHPAGDNRLGGHELRDFNRDYGVDVYRR